MENSRKPPDSHAGQLARRRRGAHPPWLGICACLAGLALAVGPGSARSAAMPSGSVVLLDARSGHLLARLPLHAEPMRVSWGAGAFWVVAPHEDAVFRVDPKRRAVKRYTIADEPYDAAVGVGTVWVPRHDGFDVVGLRVGTGQLRQSRTLEVPELASAFGFGAVWTVGADGVLYRLDPRTLRVTGTVDGVSYSSEGFEPKIAVARDALWISDAVRHVVTRVDPRRLRVVATVAHGGNGVAVAGASVWSTDGSFAWRVAPSVARLKTGSGPYDVASDAGAVWVANRFSRTLSKLAPRSARIVETLRLPGRAAAVADGGGYLAVALF